jgi:acetolactate synthase-1/2/3 large subunit
VVQVTGGPGGINALNGVFGAYMDSIPMLVISGQVKRETGLFPPTICRDLRQLGDQEVEIVPMVKEDHQVRRAGERPADDPVSSREARIHLATLGPAGALLAGHSGRCAGGPDR